MFSENAILWCFQQTQLFKNKNCMLKKQKIYEKLWVVFEHGKWCFLGLFFSGFNVIVVCFLCVCHSCKSVQNACFPSFLGFCGVAYSCLLGFGRFRCFSGSCVWFFFCSGFVFVCFGFVSALLLVLFFFIVLFFGGFKGQVRWPKGPPHLALNPPYFYFFCFCFFL